MKHLTKKDLTTIGKLGKVYIGKLGKGDVLMTNEDILKAAQAGAEKEGEAEKAILKRAVILGSIVCVALCMLTTVIKYLKHKMDFVEFAILFLFEGTINLYYGIRCHSKGKLISGIIELLIGVFFFLLFIGAMFI